MLLIAVQISMTNKKRRKSTNEENKMKNKFQLK